MLLTRTCTRDLVCSVLSSSVCRTYLLFHHRLLCLCLQLYLELVASSRAQRHRTVPERTCTVYLFNTRLHRTVTTAPAASDLITRSPDNNTARRRIPTCPRTCFYALHPDPHTCPCSFCAVPSPMLSRSLPSSLLCPSLQLVLHQRVSIRRTPCLL